MSVCVFFFFFSSRRRHTRLQGDWSSDVCSSDLPASVTNAVAPTAILNVLFRISPPPWRDRVSPWPEPQRGNPLFRKGTLRRCKERRQEEAGSQHHSGKRLLSADAFERLQLAVRRNPRMAAFHG